MKTLIPFMLLFISNVNADCTPKDLTDPDYLKSIGKEKLIEHFKIPRDQDSVGWCGAFAPSDSLSFAVGEPVSAVDVSINYYANDRSSNGNKLDKLSGVSPLSATDIAKKFGYCPESVIPSNQTSTSNLGHSAILNLMESFQKIYDDYVSKGRPADYCVSCAESYEKGIKPTLPGVTTEMIKDVLLKNQNDSLESFRSLLNKLCEGKRVIANPKVDFIYKNGLNRKTIASVLDGALDNDSMPSIGINTSYFANAASLPGGNGGHEMMIVARRLGADGKCEYEVRNSWGKGCSFYQPQIVAKCNPAKGSFWMNQDQLEAGVSDVLIIKNEKNKTELKPIEESRNPTLGESSENKINNDSNSGPSLGQKVDNFFGKVSETLSKVAAGISEALSSIWKSFSEAFKY